MIATPMPHFDELDWLDFVEGHSSPEERAKLSTHLKNCRVCRQTTAELRKLAKALSLAAIAVGEEPDSDETKDADDWLAILELAANAASPVSRRFQEAHSEMDRLLRSDPLPPVSTLPKLSPELVVVASHRVRALFRTDMATAGRLLSWAVEAFEVLRPDGNGVLIRYGIAGALESSLAYVELRDGDTVRALDRLANAENLIVAGCRDPESELGYLEHVRASCLMYLSRFDEALDAVVRAEAHHARTGDRDRWNRARHLHGIILSDCGRSDLALPIYDELLSSPSLNNDPRLHALVQLSQAFDLVRTKQLAGARSAYARATELLRSSGQEDQLFRVRVGLAEIAETEGRYEEALRLYLELRPVFRASGLAWGEIQQELSIASLNLRLGRNEEAIAVCRDLLPRARALGLNSECQSALRALEDAREHLDQKHLAEAREGVRRALGQASTGPSAA